MVRKKFSIIPKESNQKITYTQIMNAVRKYGEYSEAEIVGVLMGLREKVYHFTDYGTTVVFYKQASGATTNSVGLWGREEQIEQTKLKLEEIIGECKLK